MERRHYGRLSDWAVAWPGMKPIAAVSFHARTGSIGGSQGIAWKDSDGRPMTAYLSFSDVMDHSYGTTETLVKLVQGDRQKNVPDFDAINPPDFHCTADRASYHE
jgi:hypothetical protein